MNERRVTFGMVDPDKGREAYQWHRGFTGANQSVYARPWSEYEKMAEHGQVFSAVDEHGDYLGLCYFHLDVERKAWELGGMMVSTRERGRGLGGVLGRVVIGHILFEEDPFSRGETIMARVLGTNADPRGMLETQGDGGQAFAKEAGAMNLPASALPGVQTNDDGRIVGDHYAFDKQVALFIISEWAASWTGTLKDGSAAEVRMRPGVTMELWAKAFRQMLADAST